MLRPTLLLLTVACALALVPAAHAGTLSTDSTGRIHFVAGSGETNQLTLWVMDTGPVAARDTGATLGGCPPNSAPGWEGYLMCNGTSPHVSLGDGNDTARLNDGGSMEGLWIGPSTVSAGAGDDDVATGEWGDSITGGAGNDTIRPYGGSNEVDGGDGDDTLASYYGNDTKVGGPGHDTFAGHYGNETIKAGDGEKDTITCGEGTDTVTADWIDAVSADCETVARVGTKPVKQPSDRPGEHSGPIRPGPGPGPDPGHDPRPEPATGDRTAPRLKVKLVRKRGRRVLTVRSDEAVTVKVAGRKRTLAAGKRLRIKLRGRGRRRAVKVVAFDAAGNRTVAKARLRRR